MPGPIYYKKSDIPASDHDDDGHAVGRAVGQRMAASYINFYIANEAVILPQFGDRKVGGRCSQLPCFPNDISLNCFR